MALVFGLGIEEAGILFPMVAVLLAWFVLVGLWPTRGASEIRKRALPGTPAPT